VRSRRWDDAAKPPTQVDARENQHTTKDHRKILWHCGISTLMRRERTPRDLAAACRQRARTRDSSERASQLVVAPFPIVID